MKNGLYRYEDKSYGNRGEYIIRLTETEKSYTLELVKNDMRFSPSHLDAMFGKSSKAKVSKERSPHAMNIVGDDWFCIYPYRLGVPFAFEYLSEERSNDGKD